MKPKQIKIIAVVIFIFVGAGFLLVSLRSQSYHKKLIEVELGDIIGLQFYLDGLRDPKSLNIPITDKKDLQNFLNALKTIQPSKYQIKSLETRIKTKLYFEFNEVKNKAEKSSMEKNLFDIHIIRSVKTGDLGIISISKEGKIFSSPGGVYESAELLKWVEEMGKRKGFEEISIGN